MIRIFPALVAVFLTLLFAVPAFAATTSLVRGTVTIDGKPAPGAHVMLQGEGSLFQTTTDARGHYVFAQVLLELIKNGAVGEPGLLHVQDFFLVGPAGAARIGIHPAGHVGLAAAGAEQFPGDSIHRRTFQFLGRLRGQRANRKGQNEQASS